MDSSEKLNNRKHHLYKETVVILFRTIKLKWLTVLLRPILRIFSIQVDDEFASKNDVLPTLCNHSNFAFVKLKSKVYV